MICSAVSATLLIVAEALLTSHFGIRSSGFGIQNAELWCMVYGFGVWCIMLICSAVSGTLLIVAEALLTSRRTWGFCGFVLGIRDSGLWCMVDLLGRQRNPADRR